MSDVSRAYYAGFIIVLDHPHGEHVYRQYVMHVLRNGMSEDEFWVLMRQKNPVLPLKPLRHSIEAGAITPAPAKTPADDLVEDGFYWIQRQPDSQWTIAQAVDSGQAVRFYETMDDFATGYDEVFAIGPQVPQYVPDEDGHAHEGDSCPLCDETQLAEMRANGMARRAERRRTLLTEIEADPPAFVHVVEGYENADDRSPVIMLISQTLQGARDFCSSPDLRTNGILEITPHKLDDRRSGEVVLYHSAMVDGVRTERPGRFPRNVETAA